MLRLNFRNKLLLAMMFVVTAVCVATLLVAQRRVQQNYERMFRQQFERQIGYFTALQDARLDSVKEECLKLTQSVRMIAWLNEPEVNLKLMYETAESELRGVLNQFGDQSRSPSASALRRPQASFFRFVDAEGKPISPPEEQADRRSGPGLRRWIERRFAFIRPALTSAEIQQIAYLPLVAPTNRPDGPRGGAMRARGKAAVKSDDSGPLTLQEIIVTRIIDPADNRTVGALILGFPLPDLVPQPKRTAGSAKAAVTNQSELIQTGILIEDQLFASPSVIADSLGAAVAQQINQRIRDRGETQADFDCVIEGIPYRVFFELMNARSAFPLAYQVCLYSMAQARREQADLRWKIIGLGGGALCVALMLSLAISHGLSAPIRDLVTGTREVQKGNFQVRVPVRSQDEVGQLTASFNEMAEGLAQKEKYRTVLNMFADERVAQLAVTGELTLGGELREITVLFCDIRGFTALTENMPPGEVIEMLNEHMTALNRVVKEHHGMLDKFVGDLLMAIFGAPLRHGEDALNAARCALRLQEVRAELDQTSRHKLKIGIGLATGTVVAGCMGSPDRFNYTVLGDRVNLASRLCSRAKAGEVLIDDNTRQKLGDAFAAEPIGSVELKGFASPVQAFRLIEVQKGVVAA